MLKKFYIKKEFFVQKRDANVTDHYQFQSTVGRGSFGVVYKGKMKHYPYSTRAIKRIKKKYVKSPADFLKEFLILTSLDHPQIIKIYQTFQDDDNVFIVLDYCQGGELFKRLAKLGSFSQNEARELFRQMVNIIKYCHMNQVAHRDLKPQNFMFVSNKRLDLMLIDFGLSFRWKKDFRSELLKKEEKGMLVGTAYYMAPEIFTASYDERCDIWSLGIILYMLVTGEPPVNGITYEEILKNIKDGKLNLHTLAEKGLSKQLIDLILKILLPQKDRISLKDITAHPWMTTKSVDRKLNINFQKIRSYSKFSKFKVLVLNYIAAQLPQKEIMLLGKVFLDIDKNKDGYLTVEEMSEYFQQHDNNPHYEDIKEIIRYMDVDHNGRLAYNEFISACLSKSAANNRDYLKFAFDYFDINHDGRVSREELAIVLKAYKKEYAQNQELIDKLVKECDLNGDNEVDFQEFCKYIMEHQEF